MNFAPVNTTRAERPTVMPADLMRVVMRETMRDNTAYLELVRSLCELIGPTHFPQPPLRFAQPERHWPGGYRDHGLVDHRTDAALAKQADLDATVWHLV